MESLWRATACSDGSGRLNGDIKTDVLIVGGGMAGVLCAYFLKKAGVDCVIAEARRVGGGVTGDTTAKITSQHGLIYSKLIKKFGTEKAKQYLEINQNAIQQFANMCRDIDCDFERKDAYVYSLNSEGKIEKELSALSKLGFNAQFSNKLPLPFSVAGAVRFANQAQFNPLKFLYAVSQGLKVYENTPVRELLGTSAITDGGTITADRIIVATHFPFINKHGAYFLKMYQHRSYVIALENASQINGMYVDEAQKGMSFRNYGKYLLVGGGDHRTGKKGGNYTELQGFALRNYTGAREKYRWAAQDCMTLDGVPYIGEYSRGTKGIYVATGFNKWGMSSSMVSAMLLCDEMLGKKNPCSEVFNPSRSVMRAQLAANVFETAAGFIVPSVRRCPHLGCALKWNRDERSWDCPCHGSRFTESGKLIDNPATGDFKTEE